MLPRKLHMLFHVRDKFVDTTEPPFTHKPFGDRTVVTPLTKHNVGTKFVIPSLGRTLFIIATTQNVCIMNTLLMRVQIKPGWQQKQHIYDCHRPNTENISKTQTIQTQEF